eukprot:SAG11_NODE_1064_length_5994_cov_4.748601_1_plen_159_part_00
MPKRRRRRNAKVTVVDVDDQGEHPLHPSAKMRRSEKLASEEDRNSNSEASRPHLEASRPHLEDSRETSRRKLEWLLHPIRVSVFFEEYWEKKPLLIPRGSKKHYGDLFSKKAIERLLDNGELSFEQDVDITRYADGERSTKNGQGIVSPKLAWQVCLH